MAQLPRVFGKIVDPAQEDIFITHPAASDREVVVRRFQHSFNANVPIDRDEFGAEFGFGSVE